MIRRSPGVPLLALCVIAPMAVVSLPRSARAQKSIESLMGGTETSKPPTPPAPSTTMPIQAPGEPDTTQGQGQWPGQGQGQWPGQAQRGTVEPMMGPSYAAELPIDPDTYICSRGDVFELNFWG